MGNIDCSICDERNAEFIYRTKDYYLGEEWNMVKCRTCGLVYLNPQPDRNALMKTYGKIYSEDKEKRLKGPLEIIEYLFRKMRANEILNKKKTGSILDIGCGRGVMLKHLKAKGWETKGIEFSEQTSAIAKRFLKEDLHIGTDAIKKFDREQFDVIVIDYVLEHVSNPSETLMDAHRVMKKGGLLIVSVPNIDSLQAMWTDKRWFHLDVPKHLYQFSTYTLTALLTKAKFKIIKRKGLFVEHGLFGLWQSILNIIVQDNNRFYYSILATDGKKNGFLNSRNLSISLLFGFSLPLLILFCLWEKISRKDGLIRYYAVRE